MSENEYPLTPTEELAMEVLAARTRLGEAIWTFRSRHEKTLRSLEEQGYVFVMHGITEGTVRAGLEEKGREAFLSDGYVVPILANGNDSNPSPDPSAQDRQWHEDTVQPSSGFDIWHDDEGVWRQIGGVVHGPFATEAEAEAIEERGAP